MTTHYATATTNLYLTFSGGTDTKGGAIFNGKPDPSRPAPQLYREYRSTDVNEVFYQADSNSEPYYPDFQVGVVTSKTTGGQILASTRYGDSFQTWSSVHTSSVGLQGLAWVPGTATWVAVGENNTVVRSTNGIAGPWSESKGAIAGATWKWITYGKGRLVSCGHATMPDPVDPVHTTLDQGAIMYSDDDGATWAKANAGTGKNQLHAIAYSPELNVFVAVGDGGSIVSVNG